MTTYFRKDGFNVDHTPSAAVAAGEVVVLADRMLGVAPIPIAANTLGALRIHGDFEFPKADGVDFAPGDPVFWDAASGEATDDDSEIPIGPALRAAAEADAVVRALLLPPASVQDSGGESAPLMSPPTESDDAGATDTQS